MYVVTTKRKGISNGLAALIIIVVAIFGFAYLTIPQNTTHIGLPSSNNTSGNVAGKITFNVQDLLAGGGANAPSVYVYPAQGTVIGGTTYSGLTKSDSLTASSSGVATTALEYPVGAMLNVEVVLSNYASQWFSVESTGVTQAAQAQGTAAQVNLFITKLGTFSITVVDDQGNSYTSGTTIGNFSAKTGNTANNKWLDENTINFAITVRNTAANTGYATSTDALNGNQWGDALEMYTTGSSIDITGLSSVVRGSDTYWVVPIPDGISGGSASGAGVSMQTVNSQNVGGTFTYNLAVSKGSLAGGSTQSIVIEQQLYADVAYFTANAGSWNTAATTTGAASTFTLKVGA